MSSSMASAARSAAAHSICSGWWPPLHVRHGIRELCGDQRTGAHKARRYAAARLAANPGEMSRLTAWALADAAAGTLRPVIGQKVPLARAGDAHRAIEGRATIGKTLLVP